MWIDARENELKERKAKLIEKYKANGFLSIGQPFARVSQKLHDKAIRFCNWNAILERGESIDILFFQGYGFEFDKIVECNRSDKVGYIPVWFWDNHHLFADTTRISIVSDVSFCAHYYPSGYMMKSFQNWGTFVALASIVWTEDEVVSFREKYFHARDSKMYGGYNSYEQWPDRDLFLNQIKNSELPNDIQIFGHYPDKNLHPYYSLSIEDKFAAYCKNKVTLCSSFGSNTTIRMFDALLTGSVVILTDDVKDLRMIFNEEQQSKLGIFKASKIISDIKKVFSDAIDFYDSKGINGCFERSDFILRNHMPFNRIKKMVDFILEIK